MHTRISAVPIKRKPVYIHDKLLYRVHPGETPPYKIFFYIELLKKATQVEKSFLFHYTSNDKEYIVLSRTIFCLEQAIENDVNIGPKFLNKCVTLIKYFNWRVHKAKLNAITIPKQELKTRVSHPITKNTRETRIVFTKHEDRHSYLENQINQIWQMIVNLNRKLFQVAKKYLNQAPGKNNH